MNYEIKLYETMNNEGVILTEKLKEVYYENIFSIDTKKSIVDYSINASSLNYGYAPTTYSLLEYVFSKYPFSCNDYFLDFGCGKGRVLFMAAFYGCLNLGGIEIDSSVFNDLNSNILNFKKKTNNTSVFDIKNIDAKNTVIESTYNKFFFFDPFHLKIFIYIIESIKKSIESAHRNILLIIYRPQPSTIKFIDKLNIFKNIEQVNITDDGQNILFVIYSNLL